MATPERQTNLVSCPRGSRNKWRGLKVQRALSDASHAGEDVIGGLRPDERLAVSVVRVDEFADGFLEERLEAVKLAISLCNDINAVADFGDVPMIDDPIKLFTSYPEGKAGAMRRAAARQVNPLR